MSITQQKMLCKMLKTQLRARAGILQQTVQFIVLGRDAVTKRIVDVSKWPVDKIHATLAKARAPDNVAKTFGMFQDCLNANEDTKNVPRLLEETCRAHFDFMPGWKGTMPNNLLERFWNFLLRACFDRPFLLHAFPGDGTVASNKEENQQLTLMRDTLDEFIAVCLV